MAVKHRYQWQPLALVLVCLLSNQMLFAQETTDPEDSEDLSSADSTVVSPLNTVGLGSITVLGKVDTQSHEVQHDQVYDRSISSVYRDKTEVERFKGAAPADVFKGMVGVNSGDARNSGALDPNIRGVQGQGRVPVTVDGTEQAITVWRGYSGANNRNYIDPMLIGGMTVEKGPSLTRGINSSVGGAVAITTLGINDIVREDRDWGIDLKIEGSNNSTKPQLPNLPQGIKVNTQTNNPNFNFINFMDPNLMVRAKSGGQNQFGNDQAVRFAVGKKWDDFDILGAYVYRKKGNHYAGKNGASYYKGEAHAAGDAEYWNNYTRHLAELYKPGDEVPNTSNEMQSLLFKATWRPTEDQTLEFGARHTWAKYGEIMPSRLAGTASWLEMVLDSESHMVGPEYKEFLKNHIAGKLPQWPLSKIKMTALNLKHQWNPDNPYIDLESNLWMTNTKLDTHTSGGYPREAYPWYMQNPALKETLRNTSLTNSKNRRWGFTTSNKMELTDNLDLIIGGSYQHETLKSSDIWYLQDSEKEAFGASPYRAIPREGWRKEWHLNFNFDWRPLSWLEISAGAQKTGYSSYDEQLNRQRRAQNSKYASSGREGQVLSFYVEKSQEIIDAKETYDREMAYISENYDFFDPEGMQLSFESMMRYQEAERAFIQEKFTDQGLKYQSNNGEGDETYQGEVSWFARDDGKYYREDNPFMNGSLASKNAKAIAGYTAYQSTVKPFVGNRFAEIPKQGNSGKWQPVLSATAWITDEARVYARYAKTQRMPSMFESTVGFSATPQYSDIRLKPERGTNIEFGYMHDLSELLGAERYADIKVAYFHNSIKDVIDRDQNFALRNIDKQVISGLELQSRYDNGRFFADFSASYFLKNEVCDSSTAISQDPYRGNIANCVKDGFYNSYLRNMTPPKYALNLTMGGRFFNEKLEVGTRILHHAGSKDTDKENFGDVKPWASSVPIHWGKVTTLDAWVNYAIDENMSMEVVATNLTNQYYLDPLTRSHFPAPGRTIRIGFNMKF
ncbi:TonB-dependent receptor plug domain-containing protein [Ignatzschineria rhizosphaerae]|uniref:TonB-dependent receptor plug domain-containing protein n=1 Tax=Ignatzschineria rhizosphaerae TaxID=2923279 RepID=A0ABY3X3D8_9GAMM|nr:TonB-dependent receptor [Ignatzschineria rhizosphaerae]UNM97408.1 TonB-dependent receptor plug domain-containing protein [Ignatzschineria rhizosphaerae]